MSEAVNETARRSLLLDEPGDLPCKGFTVGTGLGAHVNLIHENETGEGRAARQDRDRLLRQ